MAAVIPLPKFIAFADDGSLLAGGLLYTYTAGSSTPKTTWSDAAETTPNANPVVLDSRGEATIYGSGSYKFVLKTAADVAIWTVDNVKIGGTVDTADIVDGAVTTAKIADGALSADSTGRAKMADGFVTSAKLDTAGVTLPNGSLATTQTTGDSTTKVATTAFVQGEFTDKTASQAEMEADSATDVFVTPGRIKYSPSAGKGVGLVQGRTTNGACTITKNVANVSSATRNAIGNYTVAWSTSFSSADYVVLAMAYNTAAPGNTMNAQVEAIATGSVTVQFESTGGSEDDPDYFSIIAFGDF